MGLALVVGATCMGLLSTVTWELSGMATSLLRFSVNPLTVFHPEALTLRSLLLCVTKNASFGAVIFAAALMCGLASKQGAAGVGDATTRAVVAGVVLSLLMNLIVDATAFTLGGAA